MPMKKVKPAASPDAYEAALTGWRRELVTVLRKATHKAGALDEVIKWGNVVYLADGPIAMIRAEEQRVLFGFWRGQRLRDIEPRLKAGGKYEMATIEFREGDRITAAQVRRLVTQAMRLNETQGDPTDAARRQ